MPAEFIRDWESVIVGGNVMIGIFGNVYVSAVVNWTASAGTDSQAVLAPWVEDP